MTRTFAAAIFALLAVTTPARAAYYEWYQIDTLNLTYPGPLISLKPITLTGDLYIIDGAFVGAFEEPFSYLPVGNQSSLSVNGTPLKRPSLAAPVFFTSTAPPYRTCKRFPFLSRLPTHPAHLPPTA
jgi:hypothetical protein